MLDDLVKGTLGPLLTVNEWVDALRDRPELNYYCQNGQYSEDATHWIDAATSVHNGNNRANSKSVHVLTESVGVLHGANGIAVEENSENDRQSENIRRLDGPSTDKAVDTLTDVSLSPNWHSAASTQSDSTVTNMSTATDSLSTASESQQRRRCSKSKHNGGADVIDSTAFATEFFGASDDLHKYYHWSKLNREVLTNARERGLEPTTLGHVLSRRNRLWAQTQCIDTTAVSDFEKHIKLYQRQFETYSRSGDGWVNINADHKVDPLFLRQGSYLKGVEGVFREIAPPTQAITENDEDAEWEEKSASKTASSKNTIVSGIYDWNNVIFCPNFGDSGEFIRRYARKSVRMYKNLYDCLVHGWVHPGLVVCEVRDATHPIRFSTPPNQDCYTVVYAGPPIPEEATQRVIFGEYTGVVYREESVEDTIFEYAFELNFSSSSWINADVEVTMDTAEITENDGLVLLPNNARFVLDSSRACNELSLVNHYQSIKAYGGEMWATPNCEWQQIFLDGWPHVVLTSKIGVAINPGDELVADFGGLWFSKVEETAHRHIRDELIKYRLGRQMQPSTVQQFEMPKRPLSDIDVALTSNATSNANAICAICYNVSEDQADDSTEEEVESVSCDGCDRFFHIHCVSNINRASALYVAKDLFEDSWSPMDLRKNIVSGSGPFYCSFCRHLAKKIYMHDTGCDYMPLARGIYGNGIKPRSMNPISRHTVGKSSPQSHIGITANNTPSENKDANALSTMKSSEGRQVYREKGDIDDTEPKSTSGSAEAADHQMEVEDLVTAPAASWDSSRTNARLERPSHNQSFMKTTSKPSLFDLVVADHRNVLKSDNCPASNNGQIFGPITQHQDKPVTANRCAEANTRPEGCDQQAYCPTCLRNLPRSSIQGTDVASTKQCGINFTTPASREVDPCYKGTIAPHNHVDTANDNCRIIGAAGSSHSHTITNGSPRMSDIATDNSTDVDPRNENVQSSLMCKSTATISSGVINDSGERMSPSKAQNTEAGSGDTIESSLSTVNIGRAVDTFKKLEQYPIVHPRFLPPDPMYFLKSFHDSTMVDYLGCKYLAGMWQIEPFALFGDCVRVCTDCYSAHGPKANVYICRLLKRHLSGNFDHPMNTTPSQMRELVLMAYEQHVQMLLRLLVLKNIAITFMCKLCCHFVGRQLLQNQSVIPPLPFSRDFVGKSGGFPEGLLANPSDLVNSEHCSSKRLKVNQKKGLEAHLTAFVTAVKNAVSSVPVSSNSDPALSYELLNAMGAFSDEFSRLANCKGIIEYLNDLMAHKVLESDNTPSQLQQTLTKDELRRFAVFRHLTERPAGAFSTTPSQPVRVKIRNKPAEFVPLIGVVPGVTYVYRKFTDGYYNGLVTKYIEGSVPSKSTFLVTYSDGDDERMTVDDLLSQILSNLGNLGNIVSQLSPNDSRNEKLLLQLRAKANKQADLIVESEHRDMLRSLTLHVNHDKKKPEGGKKQTTRSNKEASGTNTSPKVERKRQRSDIEDSSSDSEYAD